VRRTALKSRRETPRRNDGRVTQLRMKPKAKVAPGGLEVRHIARIAAMGCLVCGAPANVHHIMRAPGKIRRRDHRFIAPLCQPHHQGDHGVHGLGSEAKFEEHHGIDIVGWAVRQWQLTEQGA
jgi:hypothetical protein